jgi:hypothetical protein
MKPAELKLDLINKITNLKEARIIEEIQKYLDFELGKGLFKLSDAQKLRLTEAKFDKLISGEQADNDIEKWLSEK